MSDNQIKGRQFHSDIELKKSVFVQLHKFIDCCATVEYYWTENEREMRREMIDKYLKGIFKTVKTVVWCKH